MKLILRGHDHYCELESGETHVRKQPAVISEDEMKSHCKKNPQEHSGLKNIVVYFSLIQLATVNR